MGRTGMNKPLETTTKFMTICLTATADEYRNQHAELWHSFFERKLKVWLIPWILPTPQRVICLPPALYWQGNQYPDSSSAFLLTYKFCHFREFWPPSGPRVIVSTPYLYSLKGAHNALGAPKLLQGQQGAWGQGRLYSVGLLGHSCWSATHWAA